MSNDIVLKTEERQFLGKRVKRVRAAGQVPGVVYGPEFEQIMVQVNRRELRPVLIAAGGTQIVNLDFGDGESVPTLVREVQRDPLRGDVLHIDFYRVDLTKKIQNEVPIVVVGMAPDMLTGEAIANQLLVSMMVEALPTDIPPQIEVDVSDLQNIGDVLVVGDLALPEGVEAATDLSDAVVKLDYAVTQVEEEEEELDELLLADSVEPEVISDRDDEEEEDFE